MDTTLSEAMVELQLTSRDKDYVLDLTGYVDVVKNSLVGGGSYGDVYRGRWDRIPALLSRHAPPDIAIKVFKGMHFSDLRKRESIFKVSSRSPY